jgi:hypothetical protein
MTLEVVQNVLPIPPVPPDPSGMAVTSLLSSPDVTFWVNVALSAATLVVTGVGVIVAISAFVGYQSAKRMLKREAQRHAKKASLDHLNSAEFKAALQAVANDLVKDHIRNTVVVSLSQGPAGPKTEMTE